MEEGYYDDFNRFHYAGYESNASLQALWSPEEGSDWELSTGENWPFDSPNDLPNSSFAWSNRAIYIPTYGPGSPYRSILHGPTLDLSAFVDPVIEMDMFYWTSLFEDQNTGIAISLQTETESVPVGFFPDIDVHLFSEWENISFHPFDFIDPQDNVQIVFENRQLIGFENFSSRARLDHFRVRETVPIGIAEAESNFLVYPNPVKDGPFVLDLRYVQAEELSVYDIYGKQVLNQMLEGAENIEFGASLAPGTYLFELRTKSGERITRKGLKL